MNKNKQTKWVELLIHGLIILLVLVIILSMNNFKKVSKGVPKTEITQTLDEPEIVLPTNEDIAKVVISLNNTYKSIGDSIQIDYIFDETTIEFVINDYSINYNEYETTQGLHILKSYIQGRFLTLYNLVEEYTIGRKVIINYYIQGLNIATMYDDPETFVLKS